MTGRARLALATLALLALVTFVYAPVLHGAFIWDDHALIETNPLVASGSVRDIFRVPYWTATPLSELRPIYYRPLTMLTLRADFEVAGDDAPSFHLTNLFFHLLATVALVLAARRLGASRGAAAIAAAVWALHPRSTESVAWIAGRTDLVAGMFGIAALALWPWYGDADANASSGRRAGRVAAAAASLLAALLAKEVAIAVVLAIAMGTIAGAGLKQWRTSASRLVFLALPVALYGALRWAATHNESAQSVTLGAAARAATALEAIGRYVVMTLDPWHPATSIGLIGEVSRVFAVLGAAVVLALVALAARALIRRRRAALAHTAANPSRDGVALAVAIALGLGALVVVIQVVPLLLAASVVADRLLYLPLAALALGLAVAAGRLSPRRQRVAGAAALLLAASFAPVTHARAQDYADELEFRLVAAEHAHPHNTGARSGLANALRADAELDLACRLHASVRHALQTGVPVTNPRYVRALENLGSCYAMLGDYERASAVFSDLLAVRPESGRVQMEIGFLQLHLYAIDKAEASLRNAVRLEPDLTVAKHALESLPAVRTGLARFSTESARAADRLAWAELLTSLGRVPDANQAWLDVALDPSSADRAAMTGFEFVLANADIATVRLASEALFDRKDFYYWESSHKKFARRLAVQARIDRLRPRIERLVEE